MSAMVIFWDRQVSEGNAWGSNVVDHGRKGAREVGRTDEVMAFALMTGALGRRRRRHRPW